jgi:hypothetical protein
MYWKLFMKFDGNSYVLHFTTVWCVIRASDFLLFILGWLRNDISLVSNGYQGHFPWVSSGRGVKLTTHLQLLQRSIIPGSIHPLPHSTSWHSA